MVNKKELKVSALMTAPRYECVWARNQIEIALQKCGIPLYVSGGVFYGQCMQRMLNDVIEIGTDVALTIDFDSVFTPQDVQRLLSVLTFNDHIDAVCAFEARRGKSVPLGTAGGVTEVATHGEPIQLTTAHFGLTAIDLHRLKDVPKPWFASQPDSNGEWTDDKIDDDIWFWKQWQKAGRTIYMDTETRIGHLQEMITEFQEVDGRFEVVHTYPKEWKDRNGC